MSEKNLQTKIRTFCKKHSILSYKFASPYQRGVPDLMLIADGKVLFLEVKNPNGKGRLSALQTVEIRNIRNHGVPVYVVDDYEKACQIILEQLNPGTASRD